MYHCIGYEAVTSGVEEVQKCGIYVDVQGMSVFTFLLICHDAEHSAISSVNLRLTSEIAATRQHVNASSSRVESKPKISTIFGPNSRRHYHRGLPSHTMLTY